jgi:hypothetical protein
VDFSGLDRQSGDLWVDYFHERTRRTLPVVAWPGCGLAG